jgi:dolichyl-phosphate beta-glucosyltransferase
MAESAPELSLVIPAFNEAHRLPASLQEVAGYCSGLPWSWEALVVVENSTDGTWELASQAVAKQANFQVIDNLVHRGKGYAVRSGMLRASGAAVFYMDADLSVPLEEIGAFMRFFEQHPEACVLAGNRQHARSRILKQQSLLRRKMGQTFNRIIQSLTSLELRDTQCGFKAFRRDAAREIFSRATIDGFAFDVEVLMLAERLGFNVVDLPVQWVNSPESKVHIVRDSLRMLADAVRVRRVVERTLREKPARRETDERVLSPK